MFQLTTVRYAISQPIESSNALSTITASLAIIDSIYLPARDTLRLVDNYLSLLAHNNLLISYVITPLPVNVISATFVRIMALTTGSTRRASAIRRFPGIGLSKRLANDVDQRTESTGFNTKILVLRGRQ